jgi:hypothetical protein
VSVTDLAGALAFALVLALAAITAMAERGGDRHRIRRWRQRVIGYVVGLTALAGVSGRDAWPFSAWALMTGTPTRAIGVATPVLQLVAVSAEGREYRVDVRAVEPFSFEELRGWLRDQFFALPPAERDSAARYLLARLNAARARVRVGDPPGTQGRWLGPLRAPFHSLHPAWWTRPDDVPSEPFVSLRVYREWWDAAERAQSESAVRRQRVYDLAGPGAP